MVIALAIIPTHGYPLKLRRIIRDAVETEHSILYVSLNKTYKSLMRQFELDDIDSRKFFFIDTITPTVYNPEPAPNCSYIPLDGNFKALEGGIREIVEEKNISLVILDSLSSLATYGYSLEIIRFVSRLIGTLSALHCSAVFTCLDIDENTALIQHMKPMVDQIYELDQPEKEERE